jgi:hypothetical protein
MDRLKKAMAIYRLRKGQETTERRPEATPEPEPERKPASTLGSDTDVAIAPAKPAPAPKPRVTVHPAMRHAFGVPTRKITADPDNTEVQIASEPMGARVYADDELVGTTPCPVRVEGGDIVQVRVSLKGYRSERFEVTTNNISKYVELERY